MSLKRMLVVGICCFALAAVPALALDRIGPGWDSWVTPAGGGTFYDFAGHPIPAGFFCAGSAPFTGKIVFQGSPIKGADGADTLVERIDEATFDKSGVATTRVVVRGLSLIGSEPIQTSCGSYRVRASLAGGIQPITQMRIIKDSENTGSFESRLALRIKLVFEPLAGGKALRLEDTINFERPNIIPWVALTQNEGGVRSAFVDLNGDGRTDTRLSGSAVFFAGVGDGLHVAAYCEDGFTSDPTDCHYIDPCECCNLCAGCQCP
jgi:hypothetical protein